MRATHSFKKASTTSGVIWMSVVACLVVTLSAGASMHNHSLFGVDGGAEKIAQSKVTCPACVFDGNPTIVGVSIDVVDSSGSATVTAGVDPSFDDHDAFDSVGRAPPSF